MNKQQEENTNLTVELADLEPQDEAEIKGGTREHILLARQVGVPSLAGDWNGDGKVDSRD